ncbi:hypothetical protein [Brunnivagina elsteri]|uniref:Uncharacterized protein n=1 Tax=Brunnivagina elsteri CCALA 953 TaxID=987040 RepID=A0A2A2TE37_9CYAN|nr:hypothetical protein [Calothrix elsteri]PAX51961.1 hypothetical protein CK510_21965 [Calothrix elsteri CCALA 953]
MYYFPQEPPYFILVFGLFAAITSGAALTGTLRTVVAKWQLQGAENSGTSLTKKPLLFPFLGVTIGLVLFLVSGLEIFGFPPFLAFAIGLPISLLTCLLMWFQLGSMMTFVESRGFQALDLDSM